MTKITEQMLQRFVLEFNDKVVAPLEKAGFVRNKFNVFGILNIGRQELRHSDFLAFLMNTNRSGEVGKQFLRSFLSILARRYPKFGFDFFQFFYGDFESVSVKREYKNIDILLKFELSEKSYVVVIENKVDSSEQFYDNSEIKGQLDKYEKIATEEYPDSNRIYLFLSPDRRQPSNKSWTAVGYDLIYSALCMVETDGTDNTVKTLVEDYKKLLRGRFNMETDKKMKEAVLRIYNANADVFNFIYANLPNQVNIMADIIRDYLKKLSWVELESTGQNKYIAFSVKNITEIRKDLNIYFQITVDRQFTLCGRIKGGSAEDRRKLGVSEKGKEVSVAKSEYFKDNDKEKTAELIDTIKEYIFSNDMESVKSVMTELLDKAFKDSDGYMHKHVKRIVSLLNA